MPLTGMRLTVLLHQMVGKQAVKRVHAVAHVFPHLNYLLLELLRLSRVFWENKACVNYRILGWVIGMHTYMELIYVRLYHFLHKTRAFRFNRFEACYHVFLVVARST